MSTTRFSHKKRSSVSLLLLLACAVGGYVFITYSSIHSLLRGIPNKAGQQWGFNASPAQAASQQMYIWKDAEGTSHISTSPPPQAQNAAPLAPVRVTGSSAEAGSAPSMAMPSPAVPPLQALPTGQGLSATGAGVGLNPQALEGSLSALVDVHGQALSTALNNALAARGGMLPPAAQQQNPAQQQANAEQLLALKMQQEKIERRLHRARADNDDSHRKRLQQNLRAVQEQIAQLEQATTQQPVGQ
jgi:hypothetical protein